MVDPALVAQLKQIDWSKPDTSAGERRSWLVRCRIPFGAPGEAAAKVSEIERSALALPAVPDDRPNANRAKSVVAALALAAIGAPPADGDTFTRDMTPATPAPSAQADTVMIAGIASSTSVDFYGTEMSLAALKQMAAQMGGDGLPYLPIHNHGWAGAPVEWDEVIGRTAYAEVIPVQSVAAPSVGGEQAYVLRVTTRLYADEPLAQALLRRLERGEPIGQSVGGWFTNLQITENGDGEIERVVVLGIELDHLAVTRAPANPDSNDITSLRSRLGEAITAARDLQPAPFVRHIASVNRAARSVVCDKVQVRDLLGCKSIEALLDTAPASRPAFARHIIGIEDGGDFWTIKFSKQADLDGVLAKMQAEDNAEDGKTPEPAAVAGTVAPEGIDEGGAVEFSNGNRSATPAAVAPPAIQAGAPAIDSPDSARYSASSGLADAQRSAPTPTTTTKTVEKERALENFKLSDEDVARIAVALRSVVAPAASAQGAPAAAVPATAPVDWEARAKAAEGTLARGERVGRSVPMGPLTIGNSPQARSNMNGLITRSRTDAPALAATIEACLPSMMDERGKDPKNVGPDELKDNLRSVLEAAELDGLITNPFARAAWQ